MSINLAELVQGTDDWRAARCGKVTASRMDCVLSKIRTGEAAARRDYRCQLVAEILSGVPQDDDYVSQAMQHGIDYESMARSVYEVASDVLVEEVGFIRHPHIQRSGASCDGLVGADGVVEFKCPKTATHLQYLMDGVLPSKHEPQVMWQLACTGRKWAEFASYDPRLPTKLQLFRVRVERNNTRIAELEREVIAFLFDLDKMLETISRFA